MNITRHLYLSTAVRAPDEPAADPVDSPAPEPVVAAADAPAADPPAPQAELPLANPAPAPAPQTMVPLRVLQQRVGEESNKRQAIERRATEAETKAANLQAIIDRLQAERAAPDPAADPARAPVHPAPRPAPVEQPDIAEAVRREVDSREVTRSINDVISKGVSEFTQAQWDEKSNILAALGAATPEFVQDVIAVDPANAHRIIFELANDPGKAADLASMNVRQRTAELTRMSMAEQAKNPPAAKVEAPTAPAASKTPVSRAPAPTAVTRTNADIGEVDPTTPEGNEKMSDQQFEKWYKDKYYAKRA
jgi:hypothetical protein